MSIYLPDDLAERLKSDDGKSSQVIQEALRRYLGDDKAPSWAQVPDDAQALLIANSESLIAEAREDYQDGYRAALKRLPDLGWSTLSSFARSNFELVRWLGSWRSGAAHQAVTNQADDIVPWLWKIAADVGDRADPIGYDQFSFRRSVAFESGYSAALRAAYEVIERGADGVDDSSGTT
jgi:hypothetical protein